MIYLRKKMIQRIQTIYLLIPTIFGSIAILAIINQAIHITLFIGIASLLNLISIFLFNHRKLQIATVFISSMIFIYLSFIFIKNFNPILLGICVTSIFLNILGSKAIKKDIELLKNADRLR